MRKTENIINRTGINKTECKKTGHSKENKIPGGWNGSLFFLIIILGITLGIFAGCKNIFVPEPPATPEAAGPGGGITVSLRLFTGSARSVMPGMKSLTWEITASQGDITISAADGAYPEFSLSLPVSGTWTFTVRGINSANDGIFTGSAEQNIESGSTTSISIPLSPGSAMAAGTGQINLTLKVPDTVGTVMYKLDSDTEFTDLTPSNGSCSLNKAGVSAGPHTLSLYFLDERGTTLYMCTEAVNVWNGMTSSQWINTGNIGYITGNGEFELTDVIIDAFLNTMGSVVYVNDSVAVNAPATGSIFAPVNSVSTAVDILRKANSGGKCNGTIMVSGVTTIDREIVVQNGESLKVKGMEAGASIKNTSGRVFNIASGGSLTLGENITLTGIVTDDNGGAVYVNGGTFTMEAGSKITGSSASYGGGVYVDSKGTFTMGGGAITENSASSIDDNGNGTSGGGVCISNGTFTMSGDAVISGNTATGSGGGVFVSGSGDFTMTGGTIGGTEANSANKADLGGGVYVGVNTDTSEKGSFTMGGGTIKGNTATQNGGGVYVAGGTFTMSDTATLQGNKATTHGGGVHIFSDGIFTGTFTMNGGTIGGTAQNTAEYGGGVFVSGGTFDMNNGTISGNTVTESGGGVCISGGTFTMSDGAFISGNTATSSGGGVFVSASGDFTMNGGTIGGSGGGRLNSAENGGGVYIYNGTFTMSGSAVISGNRASGSSSSSSSGGGVYVSTDGAFTMEGGTIGGPDKASANSSEFGGGVCISGGTFTMSDGSILRNNTTDRGGGVFVQDGTFTLSGSPNISGNYRFDFVNINNVYLANGNTITIGDGGLNTSARIGVTTATSPAAGTDVQITDRAVDGAESIFIPDAEGCIIMSKEDAVYLADSSSFEVSWDTGSSVQYGSFADAISALNTPGSGGTIILQQDIDGTNGVFGASNNQPITFSGGTEENPIILDLNGHTINRELGTAQVGGTVISVSGALTLEDSTGSGKITGGNNNNSSTSGTWGGGVCVLGGAFFTMEGGNISYNSSEIGGGGVYVCNGGSFTMTGGTIGGSDANDANMDTSASNGGGGVFVNGEFTMSGGTITGNIADANGGGVAVTAAGTFTMSGTAVISANKASYGSGGGVYVFGNFTMTGGTIGGAEPNTAVLGGGVYVSSTGNFTLGSSGFESSPVVSGNKETGDSPNNVYLHNGKTLSITGKLKKAVGPGNIGVSMATTGEKFTYQWDRSGLIDTTFFFSDDTKRTVALSGSELSLNLVRVEGGSCTLNGINVTLSSFWISPYEVTQAEFKSIMTGNPNGIAPNPSHFQGDTKPPVAGEVQERRPVENVRWYDAIVYCNLLSMKEGLTPCYTIKGSTNPADWEVRPDSQIHDNYNYWNSVTCDFEADGYRLPTAAEWEYAARGGQTGMTDGSWNNTYSGSDTINDVAWYTGNSGSKTHEVGKKQANALRLYDMSGNLKEWCWNRKSEDVDSRVMGGGYYSSAEENCQVTAFDSNLPISQSPDQGFRVVRSIR